MLCNRCGKRKARVHLTDIKDGKKKELDLCEVCAKDLGVGDFLAVSEGGQSEEQLPDKNCPHCGLAFKEFADKGRLGCQQDYSVFAVELAPIIRQLHHSDRHRGKVPARLAAANRKERVLSYLREELTRAVEKEQYERAAEMRDRITLLEADTDASN